MHHNPRLSLKGSRPLLETQRRESFRRKAQRYRGKSPTAETTQKLYVPPTKIYILAFEIESTPLAVVEHVVEIIVEEQSVIAHVKEKASVVRELIIEETYDTNEFLRK